MILATALAAAIAGAPAVVASTSATAVASTTASAAVETRNPLLWPFSRDSIWNMPIGSAAKYVPAGIKPANAWYGQITADGELISVDPSAPVRTLQVPGQAGHGAQVRVAPDLKHNGSWNGCASLLTADGKAVWQGQPLTLSPGGNPSWTWTTQKTAVDLRGPGFEGCHGGSHLSGIGGSLRVGELNSSAPLRHALKINLFCTKYCFNGGTQDASKRWPASTADATWLSRYKGTVPGLKMGALLAVPPTADLSGITHPKARKIALALRDFGGYLVDDTDWDVHALSADQRMLTSGEWPGGSDPAFHAQLQQVFQRLAIVDNNSPTSVGGGGTPRAPLAPCFTGDTACLGTAPTTVPAPTPTTAPAPTPTTAPTTAPVTAPTTNGVVDTPLSALAAASSTNGWGPVEKDRSNGELAAGDGRTLTIGGRTFSRGLGVHGRSDVTYALDGRFAHFTTSIGVDDEVGSRGSVVFEVYVDGVLKQRSARLTGIDTARQLSTSVYGAKTLRLVVTDAGDGNASDHADWADPMLWAAR